MITLKNTIVADPKKEYKNESNRAFNSEGDPIIF